MNPTETKFTLRLHRADGRYARNDPLFAEALTQAESSPELAAWLAREHRIDAVVANTIEAIPPPAGLRETILAGARASRLARPWWRKPSWLAAAAALALVASVLTVSNLRPGRTLPPTTLAEFALQDVAHEAHGKIPWAPAAVAMFRRLSDDSRPIPAGVSRGFAEMRDAGCTTYTVAGQPVVEICVERNGAWYHLYATPSAGRADPAGAHPAVIERGQLAVATWTAGDTTFTLATNEGMDALRRVI